MRKIRMWIKVHNVPDDITNQSIKRAVRECLIMLNYRVSVGKPKSIGVKKDVKVDPRSLTCPVCGFHCSGKGGLGCIDKPSLVDKRYIFFNTCTHPYCQSRHAHEQAEMGMMPEAAAAYDNEVECRVSQTEAQSLDARDFVGGEFIGTRAACAAEAVDPAGYQCEIYDCTEPATKHSMFGSNRPIYCDKHANPTNFWQHCCPNCDKTFVAEHRPSLNEIIECPECQSVWRPRDGCDQ